jgi:hypothetical protein
MCIYIKAKHHVSKPHSFAYMIATHINMFIHIQITCIVVYLCGQIEIIPNNNCQCLQMFRTGRH